MGKSGRRSLPLLQEMDKDAVYNSHPIVAPRLSGLPLRLLSWLLESPLRSLIIPKLLQDNGFYDVMTAVEIPDSPMFIPQFPPQGWKEELETIVLDPAKDPGQLVDAALRALPVLEADGSMPGRGAPGFRHMSILDYSKAYRDGRVTPADIAERLIEAVAASERREPPMRMFIAFDPADIRRQAATSTARHAAGTAISVFDGVPVAVKDEIDCLPHPTTDGMSWLADVRPVREDAVCVARLRECGAILIGKTNMHEAGLGTTGLNVHYGTARNPHNPQHYTGGSSAGSAAAVAAGLCPVALGVDGGGSIRIPASLCGVVGFKGTFGRTSLKGLVPIAFSVGMVGPITATVEDALLTYAAMQGTHPEDRLASIPPPAHVPSLGNSQDMSAISALKLGIFSQWFNDCDSEVSGCCHRAIRLLQDKFQIQVVEVSIPELFEMRMGHFAAFGSEVASALGYDCDHGMKGELSRDTRCTLALFNAIKGRDYVQANRVRARCMHHHLRLFEEVDVIITPTTAMTAPEIPEDALSGGESNLKVIGNLMRFIIAGNFVGLPAVSVPVGHDEHGLPIGLQIIGRPWGEATVLRLASAIQSVCSQHLDRPSVYYQLLERKS